MADDVKNVVAFGGRSDILSNFHPFNFKVHGIEFSSSEQAYQWGKAVFHDRYGLAREILGIRSAFRIWLLSKKIRVSSSWHSRKVDLMRDIIRLKAECCPRFKNSLLATGNKYIVEAVASDKFWSCGVKKAELRFVNGRNWPGENQMGRLLMELRDQLRVPTAGKFNKHFTYGCCSR